MAAMPNAIRIAAATIPPISNTFRIVLSFRRAGARFLPRPFHEVSADPASLPSGRSRAFPAASPRAGCGFSVVAGGSSPQPRRASSCPYCSRWRSPRNSAPARRPWRSRRDGRPRSGRAAALDGRAERLEVGRVVDQQAVLAVDDLVDDAADGARDDRPRLPHRLGDGEAEALGEALLDDDRGVALQGVDDRGASSASAIGSAGEVHAAAGGVGQRAPELRCTRRAPRRPRGRRRRRSRPARRGAGARRATDRRARRSRPSRRACPSCGPSARPGRRAAHRPEAAARSAARRRAG